MDTLDGRSRRTGGARADAGNTLPRVRLWAVGQAVALNEGMKLLAQRALRAGRSFRSWSAINAP